MSKFLALGLSMSQIIEMSTINPARAINAQNIIGSLKSGMEGDVSILELQSGRWVLEDSLKETVAATELLAPVMAVKSGQVVPAQPVAQPPALG
jgi:dihydroorotase